ncbi:hypothetical protein CHUAL_000816 [Chamberlinius hualienensis]
MNDSKWSNETIVQFLEIYERHKVLWDVRLDNYKNRQDRDLEVKKLIEELKEKGIHLDPTTLRMKIKSLKTVYNQELDKVLISERNADHSSKIYKPRLFWFDRIDRFLRSVTFRKDPKVYLRSSLKRMKTQDEGSDQVGKRKSLRTKIFKFNNSPEYQEGIATSSADDVEECDINKADHTTPAILSACTIGLDEIDHFGKYVAASLRKMPSVSSLRCQQEIQNIITNERIQLLTQRQHDDSGIFIHCEDT